MAQIALQIMISSASHQVLQQPWGHVSSRFHKLRTQPRYIEDSDKLPQDTNERSCPFHFPKAEGNTPAAFLYHKSSLPPGTPALRWFSC